MTTAALTHAALKSSSRDRSVPVLLAGAMMLLLGAALGFYVAMKAGVDYPNFYYVAGRRYLHGDNPWFLGTSPLDLDKAAAGVAPPAVLIWHAVTPLGVAFVAPFALFPLQVAKLLWISVSISVFYAGAWAAINTILNNWSWNSRWLLFGLTGLSSSFRWDCGQANIALLVAGAMGLFLYAFINDRPKLVLVTALLIWLKFSCFLPVIGMLVFVRKWKLLGCIALVIAVGELIASIPIGLHETATSYRLTLGAYAAPGSNNDPDAKRTMAAINGVPSAISLPPGMVARPSFNAPGEFLHWSHMFSAIFPAESSARIATFAAVLLVVLAMMWVGISLIPIRQTVDAQLILFGVLILVGTVAVSHIKYDIIFLLYMLFIALRFMQRNSKNYSLTLCVAVTFFFTYLIFGAQMYTFWLQRFVLPDHIWLLPIFCYGVTIALFSYLAGCVFLIRSGSLSNALP